jgi:hypothetical protein
MPKAKELQELGKWKVGMLGYDNGSSITSPSVVKITRITDGRGGTLYINSGEKTFDISGNERGGSPWHRRHIEPATEEDLRNIQGRVIKSRLTAFNWRRLSNENAVKVEEFLNQLGIVTK